MENLINLGISAGLLLGYIWLFWLAYILIMGFYRAKLNNRLSTIALILGSPMIILGIIMDVAANLIIAPFVFLDIPREWLVTTRLQRYVNSDHGWRNKFANFICNNLLDVFDPSGNHC